MAAVTGYVQPSPERHWLIFVSDDGTVMEALRAELDEATGQVTLVVDPTRKP